jgi:hypothetical protein
VREGPAWRLGWARVRLLVGSSEVRQPRHAPNLAAAPTTRRAPS